MCRRPSLDHFLYFLFTFLSLAFISLLFVSLSVASPWATEVPGMASSSRLPQLLALKAVSTENTNGRETSGRSQTNLEKQIQKELVTLANCDVYDNIDFSIDSNDVVTLLGEVCVPSLKARAERVVNGIEGVRSVVDQLEVLPASPLDDRIRRATFFKIYWQAQLRRYLTGPPSIHIIVKNGKLALEGIVAAETDRALAGMRANQVLNVFKVINNLRIENPQQPKNWKSSGFGK